MLTSALKKNCIDKAPNMVVAAATSSAAAPFCPPLVSSPCLPSVAGGLLSENLAFVTSLRIRRLPFCGVPWARAPRFEGVVCVAAAVRKSPEATKPKGQPYTVPLIVRDQAGNLVLKTTDVKPLGNSKNQKHDVKPLGNSKNQKQDGSSSLQPPQPTTVGPSKRATVQKKAPKGQPKYSKAARRFYNQKFKEPQRLSKVLAAAGVASRRTSEEFIFAGRVSVNGDVCKTPQTLVDPLKDLIYVDGSSLPKKLAPKLYFALNKPKGYICSCGENESKSVLSLFDDYMKIWVQRNPGLSKPRLFTVGRLDVATSGLLFVTNDGEFAFNVSHPSSGLTKEYIVTVEEKVTKRQLQVIADGTVVQGVRCVPDAVELLDGEQGDTRQRLRIVVSEGRNHEVRHLVENAGLEVHALKRVRIGGFRLSRTLGLGKHQSLSEVDVKKISNENLENAG